MTIIVHTVEQAIDALEAAAELNVPVTLQTAPDAAAYAGSLYLLHMFAYASAACPAASARFVLDAGESEAEAIAAMQTGHKAVRSHAPAEARAKLADIAGQYGIEFLTSEEKALDLLDVRAPKAACLEWLKNPSKPSINAPEPLT